MAKKIIFTITDTSSDRLHRYEVARDHYDDLSAIDESAMEIALVKAIVSTWLAIGMPSKTIRIMLNGFVDQHVTDVETRTSKE